MNSGAEKTAAELAIVRLERELNVALLELEEDGGHRRQPPGSSRFTVFIGKLALLTGAFTALLWEAAHDTAVILFWATVWFGLWWLKRIVEGPTLSGAEYRVKTLRSQLNEKRRIANS